NDIIETVSRNSHRAQCLQRYGWGDSQLMGQLGD
ncbi:MAG: hypothetical protein QOH27_4773, partial [Mycobacterium sp.]|nr:hypothetical protein [Mycobacterium sp.]